MKTVLITGASSGIGRATAIYFQENGWNVIATMRNPDKEESLNQLDNTLVEKLDVTKIDTIENAVQKGIDRFGSIDVAKQLRTGYVFVNEMQMDPGAPWGGYKTSGVGRDGVWGIEEMLEIKAIGAKAKT